MKHYEPITLPEFLQLHDRVALFKTVYDQQISPLRLGTVIGFHSGESYVQYGQAYEGSTPGKYTGIGAPLIRFDDGAVSYEGCHNLTFVDVNCKERKDKMYAMAAEFKPHAIVSDLFRGRIEDLPKTPFIPGDKVKLTVSSIMSGRWSKDDPFYGELYITWIDYPHLGQTCDDRVTPYPVYTTSPTQLGGVSCSFSEKELELVQHGDLWTYYIGDKSTISFNDLESEAKFHRQTGRCKQMRNPAVNNYSWTKDEVLKAIEEGTVDALSVQGGLFGASNMTVAYKFDDVDLGARMRKATLDGFNINKVDIA